MVIARQAKTFICSRCPYQQSARVARCLENGTSSRAFTKTAPLPQQRAQASAKDHGETASSEENKGNEEEQGGMSRRLAQMTDESIQQGGLSAKKTIEEGGFSEELKRQLEARIQNSSFKSDNPTAFAQADMPVRPKPCQQTHFKTNPIPVQRGQRYA